MSGHTSFEEGLRETGRFPATHSSARAAISAGRESKRFLKKGATKEVCSHES